MTRKKKSFEEKISELEEIVQTLKTGESGLQEVVHHYSRGIKLVKECQSELGDFEQKIYKLSSAADGSLKKQLKSAKESAKGETS